MLNGEASAAEQKELSDLLSRDELLHQKYDLLVRIWKEKSDEISNENNSHAGDVVSRIISRATIEGNDVENDSRRKRRNRTIGFSLAFGSLVGVMVVGWFLKNEDQISTDKNKPAKESIITENGSRTRSLLPDGTTVWLNAGSKLFYEKDFHGATREVRLEGEAFFDVVTESGRPFIVHTSDIDIRVLGTAFNVKSYPEDKNVETTLYRGQVQVLRQNDAAGKAIQLIPNQKLVLSRQAAKDYVKLSDQETPLPRPLPENFIITHIDSSKKESERIETAWVYSRLQFRGNGFEELAKKLERWYNVKIIFNDERVKKLNFNGTFENETVEQAFQFLQKTISFNYKIKNNEITISSSQ